MVDPFSNIRRRTSGMTYGRRAQAARRVSAPGGAFGSGSSKPPSSDTPQPLDLSDSSVEESDGEPLAADASTGTWARRTAHSALSRLEQLYESTRSQDSTPSGNSTDGPGGSASSRSILDQTKNRWDLGDVLGGKPERAMADSKETDQQQRVVLDNTDMLVSAEEAAKVRAKAKVGSRTRNRSAAIPRQQAKPPSISKAVKAVPAKLKRVRSHTQPELPQSVSVARPADSSKNPRHRVQTKLGFEMGIAGPVAKATPMRTKTRTRGKQPEKNSVSQSASQPIGISDDPWGLGEVRGSSPVLPSFASKRSRSVRGRKFDNLHSLSSTSSPPLPLPLSAASQTDVSQKEIVLGLSDSDTGDSEKHVWSQKQENAGGSTPKAQTGNQHILEKAQGPSSASLKRLQSRAFSHNVVFTYGRPRSDDGGNDDDDDDYDGGNLSKFRRPSGSSRSLNMRPPLLLNQGSNALAGGAIGAYKSPQEPLVRHNSSPYSGEGTRTASSESFRRLIGDILQRIGSTDSMRVSACGDLIARLGQQEFRDELLGSMHWLTTLLRSMQRVRGCPLVSASMIVLVRAAFVNPEVMQSLVFDHHILEIVAEVLKATVQADILVRRDPSDFDCDSQYRCATAICQTVRALGLVDDILAVSTYNLVLAALRSFMRDDDVAYLAMAELLRGELHESGCLALIVERAFARSIPTFVKQISSQPVRSLDGSPFDDSFVSKVSARNAAAAAADFRNGDDMWMDFDLPDESQHPASLRGLPNHRQQADKCTFRRELDPQLPSRLAVSLELELLKFSATASRENQDEILGEKAVVPALLSLLAACQQSSVRLRGQSLVKALETAVLVLQLLVNLSNSSTEFCSQFIRQNGLEAVSKSIMFVSRMMADGMLQTESSSSNPASTGAANSSSTTAKDLGDLWYDTLLIAAALLTNIVDADSSAATHFNYVFQNPHCPLDSRCYPECACASRTSLVGLLARAFAVCHAMAAPADSSQPDALVAAGYLAVLLGFLMRDSPGSHRAILQHLPGQSAAAVVSRIEGFIRLTDSINERFGKLLGGLGTAAFGLPEPGSGRQTHLLGQHCTESPPSLSVARSAANVPGGPGGSSGSSESAIATSLQTVLEALKLIQ